MNSLTDFLLRLEETDKSEYEESVRKSFEKNERDYWAAHAQFGSDVELRNLWFYGVGHDVGFKSARNALKPLIEMVRCQERALAIIGHECMRSDEDCPTREQMQKKAREALATVERLARDAGEER